MAVSEKCYTLLYLVSGVAEFVKKHRYYVCVYKIIMFAAPLCYLVLCEEQQHDICIVI